MKHLTLALAVMLDSACTGSSPTAAVTEELVA